MNESRFTFFWLYVIDLHNHHSIGDVRHAVNPTSPFRMQMILESAIANAKTAKKVEDEKESSEVDLASMMQGLDIVVKTSSVYCNCTRKCATKKCSCLSSNVACNELCHQYNNSCTNK